MNKHFDIAYLRKYVNGELSNSEMYAIEKASHEDELLMDLILGLEEEKAQGSNFDASAIHSTIYERTHPKKVYSLRPYKLLSIAASFLLVLGIGAIWYFNRSPKQQEMVMESAAVESSDQATDTTLNSINVDSLDRNTEEDQLIAMASPEASPATAQTQGRVLQEDAKAKKSKSVEDILADREELFLREVPRNDTSAFHNKYDMRVASAAPQQKKAASSDVILLNGKTGVQSALEGRVAGVSTRRVSSLQDVKKLATGRVLDGSSGRPIINASVRDIKTNDVVMTDSSGQYVLPLTSENQKLEILSLGYQSQQIIASNNKIVQLNPSFDQLDEVVVVGYGNKSPKIKSEPLVGWVAYKKYINDNSYQTLLGKGSVTLVFDISTFGRPIDITVKKSTNPDLNQKAIHIIQNGPDWKKGNDGKKIEVKIGFR